MDDAIAIKIVESFGYRVTTRALVPERFAPRVSQYTGAFVLFDPLDGDDKGFLIVGDNAGDLAREAIEHLELGTCSS